MPDNPRCAINLRERFWPKNNRDKTCIFFSSNTKPELQTRIQQVLAVPAIRQYEKYLGMSAFVGREKKVSLYQGVSVEKITGLVREAFITSW